jgi:hypothetical protein
VPAARHTVRPYVDDYTTTTTSTTTTTVFCPSGVLLEDMSDPAG